MWPKLWLVVLFITISILIEEGYGLTCLRCGSRNVNGSCKNGGRSRLSTKRYQTCYGRKPRCYSKATVDENGNALFKRGCTLKNICTENDGLDLEYCSTCSHKYCNYLGMAVDHEVVKYLRDIKVSKNSTASTAQATTKQDDSIPDKVTQAPSETVTKSLPKSVPEAVPETVSKPVSDKESNTEPKNVSVVVSESVPSNVTEK